MLLTINWSGLLSNSRVLKLFQTIVSQKISSIQPFVGPSGEASYTGLPDIPAGEALPILEGLVKEGVLERRTEGRLIACNTHQDALDIGLRLKCPNCSSLLIRTAGLVQHICGYVASDLLFKGGSCPKCGRPSPTSTLKKMGRFYECDDCKGKFAGPTLMLYCRKYDHEFPVQDAHIIDQASFVLTPEAAKGLDSFVGTLITLKAGVEALGMTAEISGSIKGVSGVLHTFDLVVKSGAMTIPIDLKMLEGGSLIDVAAVLGTYAKVLDTKSDRSVLVTIPGATENARKSAASYGLQIVEGNEVRKVMDELGVFLGALKA